MNIEEIYIKYLECLKASTDTRNISGNEMFFALKGASFDGNQYAKLAFELGARYCVVDDKEVSLQNDAFIFVNDVLDTLQQLALFHRKKLNVSVIAITGSNGKTTTTLLTYHILKQAGLNVGLGGNVGRSFARQVAECSFDYYVLEISSFQLDNMYDFKADIAILTNITPDHLDRYEYDINKYADAKLRIVQNQTVLFGLSMME